MMTRSKAAGRSFELGTAGGGQIVEKGAGEGARRLGRACGREEQEQEEAGR